MAGSSWTHAEVDLLKKHDRRNKTEYQVYIELKKEGVNRTFNAVARKRHAIRLGLDGGERFEPKYEPVKIGYLDIESTALDSFGTVLTWCIKERDGEISHDSVTREELIHYKEDKRIIRSLCEEMARFDQLYTYYGGDYHFDIPMIRTKAIRYGIPFPAYGKVIHYDIWSLAKKKLRFRRYSLAAICEFFGIKGKTPLDHAIWMKGKYGHRESLAEIMVHNKGDVKILEELHKKLETFQPAGKASI